MSLGDGKLETIPQNKFELRKLKDLINWADNPRSSIKEDRERLLEQIKRLGIYKTLLVNQDNIALGGNQRLPAFISIFGEDYEVMCGIVSTADESEMLEYALSDNDQTGVTDDLKLAELFKMHPIRTDIYKLQSNTLRPLHSVINPTDTERLGGEDTPDESEMDGALDSYLHGNIKQIVLYYQNEQYQDIIDKISKIGETFEAQNNTEIITKLIEAEYERIISNKEEA